MNSEWTEAAITSPACSPPCVESYLEARFGEKRVSFDSSDTETNKFAVNWGFTVVHGGMMSAGAWKDARNANAI